MTTETYLLDPASLAALADGEGQTIGFVGSPSEGFRDSWISRWNPIVIEVGGGDLLVSVGASHSDLESVAMIIPSIEVRWSKSEGKGRPSFPRYPWWRGQAIDRVLVVRDDYRYEAAGESGYLVVDRGVVLVTETKTIVVALTDVHDDARLVLSHEPADPDRIGVITQPAARDLAWVDLMEHSRQLLEIEEAGTR